MNFGIFEKFLEENKSFIKQDNLFQTQNVN
jgi:hypothetical protein